MQLENVEDIYKLSPTQHGMLFHSLYDQGSGTYVQQVAYTLVGKLDATALRQAWQCVLDRHPALRTIFLWQDIEEPLQVVRQQVQLPWQQHDWRGISAERQQKQLELLFEEQRRRGFALDEAPLMNCTLIRTGEEVHWFIWNHHHVLLDGWSIALVLGEVFALYQGFSHGTAPRLATPPPYRDYIAWLQQQDASSAESFWRETLRGFAAPSSLPGGPAAGPRQALDDSGSSQTLELPEAQTAELRALAQQHHLTLNTVVQGAWALLLSRYAGAEDIVFGVTSAGRPADLPGVESMVGLFINTLPARAQISRGAQLIPWLQALQRTQVERERYSHSPLVEVQGWSEVPRGTPLFESLLVFENAPANSAEQAEQSGLQIRDIRYDGRTNYALTIGAVPGARLLFEIQYSPSRFDDALISRMLGHLLAILHSMVERPQQRLDEIDWLGEAERRQLVAELSPPVQTPVERCLHELFEEQAARSAGQVALVLEQQELTYGELNERADALARLLQAMGVGPERAVGLYLDRSIEMVVGLLAVLKAGGVAAPLDTAQPAERLSRILDQLQPIVILTQRQLAGDIAQTPAQLLLLEADLQHPAVPAAAAPAVQPHNLAYVIFTSGSTGQPKGVMVPHAALAAHCLAAASHYAYTPADRVLQFAVLHFDAALEQLLAPLLAGATLVLRGPQLWDAQAFAALLSQQRLSVINLPTAYAHQLIHSWRQHASAPSAPRLRLVIFGGEALQPETLRGWRQIFGPQLRLLNAYGPTEAVITATTAELAPDLAAVPIGRPLGPRRAYVHDAHGALLPRGVVGELWLGGACLARGYLGQPALTAQQFVPDPWSDQPGARCYRSGDLVRWDAAGALVFVGRADQQIKLRGFRIELGEIEAAIAEHPWVNAAAATIAGTGAEERRIIAYVAPAAAAGQATAAQLSDKLIDFLKQRLPGYMLPARIVRIEALPLTASGKLDRLALPAPDEGGLGVRAPFIAPRTFVEQSLAAMWVELLHIDSIGVYDNFFALGGHSLLLLQLASRVRETFQVELPLRALFDAPTVVDMSKLIAQSLIEEVDPESVDELLHELQELSPEELALLLAMEDE